METTGIADREEGTAEGESGAAGLAALGLACANEDNRRMLGLDRGARVLLFSTEGATDPHKYEELTGLDLKAIA